MGGQKGCVSLPETAARNGPLANVKQRTASGKPGGSASGIPKQIGKGQLVGKQQIQSYTLQRDQGRCMCTLKQVSLV